MRRILFLIYILTVVSVSANAQINTISWKKNSVINIFDKEVNVLDFDNAIHYEENSYLPLYFHQQKLDHDNVTISFLEGVVTNISNEHLVGIEGLDKIENEFRFEYFFSYERKQPVLNIQLIPIRYNKSSDMYEKLESFYYFIDDLGAVEKSPSKKKRAANSKLSKGNWYKFYVAEDGIYKITYQELKDLGIDVDNINPKTIQIFGNGGKMLPELAGAERYDDLNEVPIWVVGEEDEKFNSNDYILFYGDGPDKWVYRKSMFMFQRNLYTRKSGYFLTFGQEPGKRIENRETVVGTPSQTVTDYINYTAHEPATSNPVKTGKKWYGETFDVKTNQSFSFKFSNINKNKDAKMFYEAAGRQYAKSTFKTNVEDFSKTFTFPIVGTSLGSIHAFADSCFATFTPTSDNITVDMSFSKPTSVANAWLRCIYINVYSKLSFSSGSLFFRIDNNDLTGGVAEYKISTNANINNIKILDITKPTEPTLVKFSNNQSAITFPFYTDKIYQYVCFDGSSTKSVEYAGKIANQNIHAMESPDMLIVYKDILEDEVKRLYDYHNNTGLKTYMLEVQNIYNEFSSGVPDICAIRDLLKMWYDNADNGKELKYLLLVGGASYDPLNRITSNTNDILIYQNFDTHINPSSVCNDDFYGFLDDNEGLYSGKDAIDVAVGRIPTGNVNEVKNVIDKILHYVNNTSEQHGDWRNIITLLADDADNGETEHLTSADSYAVLIENDYKEFNVNKLYAGAYNQITTAGGQRYPDVTAAVNARIDKGTLLFLYSGHGGIRQLAVEQLVSIADINSWKNYDRLAFFVTATCSFAVYDDPSIVSAGELVLLNNKGGAVGMLTTTRATSTNSKMFRSFFRYLFEKDNNNFRRIGDVVKDMKNSNNATSSGSKVYALLGDPAITLNYPKYNSVDITKMLVDGVESDTLKAFSIVEIEGEVQDYYGNILSNYNGILYPEVHDKPVLVSTLGNDGAEIQTFYSDNSILYKGKASIKNGKFKFSFIVPKDIAYTFGEAKMSFYFTDGQTDGNGYYNKYVVGGNINPTEYDNKGPDIELFVNDTLFINGGYTNENPIVLAKLFDESGINTTGNGIGHDIVGYLDDNMDRVYNLNTFYEYDLDSYKSGRITYPLFKLESGKHKISIRAWDVYNNSSTAELEFMVMSSDTIYVSDIYNYPNPFSDKTTFVLSHNQYGNVITAKLYIASLSGQIINVIEKSFISTSQHEHFLVWDGKTKNGRNTEPGLYIYKLVLTNEIGETISRSGKLIKSNNK